MVVCGLSMPGNRPCGAAGSCVGARQRITDPAHDIVCCRHILLRPVRIDDALEELGSGDEQADAVGSDRQFAGADGAQIVFQSMRELLGGPELDHRRNALERMIEPEQFIDDRALPCRLVGCGLEGKQGGAGARQVLIALGVVVVQKSGEELVRH